MKAQLHFRFDQFSKHLTETFFNLFSSHRLCDVRLIGDDGVPVMGHRVILEAFSRTLNDFIEENSAPTLEIRIQGMNYHDLERIIQFMYLGEASVAHAETEMAPVFVKTYEIKNNTLGVLKHKSARDGFLVLFYD